METVHTGAFDQRLDIYNCCTFLSVLSDYLVFLYADSARQVKIVQEIALDFGTQTGLKANL